MGSNEIDCNHDNKYEQHGGIWACKDCFIKFRCVPNGPDDFNWEEVEE